MQQKNKSVLFVAEDDTINARPVYRALNPAKGLRNHGFNVRVCPVLYEQENHTFNGWIPGETTPAETPKFIIAHTFVTPKERGNGQTEWIWESQAEIIETARVHGQKFLFDLDDDIWNIPEWNPDRSRINTLAKNYHSWVHDVNSSNGLICSTASIAKSAMESGDIKVPIFVARNSIDTSDYVGVHEKHMPIRLGWIGDIDYRIEDFKPIIPTLYKVLDGKRHEVEFWHIGTHFEIGTASIRDYLPEFPVDIVERPWIPAGDFYKAIRQIDVCLIPAVNHTFNHGRSNATGLACIAGGIPFIASSMSEYESFDLCISNKLQKEWEYELNRLLTDSDYRDEVVEFERPYLYNFHTPKKVAERYIEIFEEICQS